MVPSIPEGASVLGSETEAPDSGPMTIIITREGFVRKNIVAVSFFQNCAIHPYS